MNKHIARLGGLAAVTFALVSTTLTPAHAADSNDGFYSIPPQDSWSWNSESRFQPRMDFDKDGCLAVAAVTAEGEPNPGLKTTGDVNGNCHDERDLDNTNVYSRSGSPSGAEGVTGYLYAYYFEKDQILPAAIEYKGTSHRHDWEHVVVWTQKDDNGEEHVIGTSNSRHSGWESRKTDEAPMDGEHPYMKYHKDGIRTHYIRAAHYEDINYVTNPRHTWQTAPLLSWDLMSDPVRNTLNSHDYGSATIRIKDSEFSKSLDESWANFTTGANAGS